MKFLNLRNRIRKSLVGVVSLVLLSGAFQLVQADAIPYPDSGSYNTVTYSFTAASSGDVTACIVGGFYAGYENQMGLLVNGVPAPAGYGLDNHGSVSGDSFNLGHVNVGDSLVFVLHNLTQGMDAYSDPSRNIAYDDLSVSGHNHIYSTSYTATSPSFPGVPVGTYVAFEDLSFPYSDYNYDDESFVFTNTVARVVPAPATLLLFGPSLVGLAAVRRRFKK